jgi:hypothetical protein
MGKAYSTNSGEQKCIQDIGGKARRKKPLRRPRSRWVDKIVECRFVVGNDRGISKYTAAVAE